MDRIKKQKRLIILIGSIMILAISAAAIYYFATRERNSTPSDQQPDENNGLESELSNQNDPEESTATPIDEDPIDEKSDQPVTPPPSEEETEAFKGGWWEYPIPILQVTRSGDELLVLVNKKYQLQPSYAPSDLVQLNNINIRVPQLQYARSIIFNDLSNLGSAAAEAGYDLSLVSAYRSYDTQASTYQYWVNYNGGNAAIADTISARPGHSQHQLGTAVDFSSSEVGDQIGQVFNGTATSTWLLDNGWKHGFVIAYPEGAEEITGYAYESWHYRYIGVENAAEWKGSGLTLEEWLQQKNSL